MMLADCHLLFAVCYAFKNTAMMKRKNAAGDINFPHLRVRIA